MSTEPAEQTLQPKPVQVHGKAEKADQTAQSEPFEKPVKRGLDAKGMIILGIIGGVFLLTLLAFAFPDEPAEEPAYIGDVEEPPALPEPGNYSLSFEITEFETTMPAITKQMVDQLAKEAARTVCLPDNEPMTLARFFAADPPETCPVEDVEIVDGKLVGNVQCKEDGSVTQADVAGELSADKTVIDYTVKEYFELFGPSQNIEYTMTSTATRLGDC